MIFEKITCLQCQKFTLEALCCRFFFSKLFFLTILENFTKKISAEGSPSSSEVLYFGAELVFERLPSNINNYYLQLLPKCNFSCTSTGKVCSRKYSICARADFKFVFANTIAIVCARYMYSRIPHYIMDFLR